MFCAPDSALTRAMTLSASSAVRSGYLGAPLTGSRRTVPPMRATPSAAAARFFAASSSCSSGVNSSWRLP
ncbi:hypothetical protein D3C73_1479940 [compost metagenome]